MKRFGLLLLVAGCGGEPTRDERVLTLFDRIGYLLAHYNTALATQDPLALEAVTNDLRKETSGHFDLVVEGLQAEDVGRQADAAFALGFSRNRAAVGPLTAATASPHAEVRANAIASLGMLAFPDADPAPFAKLLEDPSPQVRAATLFGLRAVVDEKNDRGLLKAVIARLGDDEASVRNEAVILLRKLRRLDAHEAILEKALRDPDPLVRVNGALALGASGPAAAAANPHLIELLRDETAKVVEAAWVALNRINEKDFDRSYGTWRDWYDDEQKHRYVCEEHKDQVKSSPGPCPTCGRKLERVPWEAAKKTEPTTGFFQCPEHPQVQTTMPSTCGREGCGKALVPAKPPPTIYVCPEHPEVLTTSPSVCGRPGCGKTLVPKK